MSTEIIEYPIEQRKTLKHCSSSISKKLGEKVCRLVDTSKFLDMYEAITAVLYLCSSASNIRYVTLSARLQSFTEGRWDMLGKTQHSHVMAESGFYYLQEDDHVKCFFCDLGLKDWDHGDDPLREHVKFSPLCFYLKATLGLETLREMSERPPNYPTSYSKQDHNQLVKLLLDEFTSPHVDLVCKLGFSDTKVLLCVCRKFIRFRQKYERNDLIREMHKEWDREMKAGDTSELPIFFADFDLASVAMAFNAILNPNGNSADTTTRSPTSDSSPSGALRGKCRVCNTRGLEVVCLPCGHLSMCLECSRITRRCPAVGCGKQASNYVRAFVT